MDNQSIIYLVVGLALGLFGWLLYWAGLPLIGGVIGASAGASLGYVGSAAIQGGPEWLPSACIGAGFVLGAILGVYLMRALQLYFFFATGAILGGSGAFHMIKSGILHNYIGGIGSVGSYVTICLFALVAGLLLVKMRRFIVAFVTSVIGASLFAMALKPEWRGLGLPVSFIVFMAVQIGLVKRFVDIEKFDRRAGRYRYDREAETQK